MTIDEAIKYLEDIASFKKSSTYTGADESYRQAIDAATISLEALKEKKGNGIMCEYCCHPYKELECDIGAAEMVTMIPFPAIDLTTGEKYATDRPYSAIRVLWYEDGYDAMEDFIRIEYCPKCGRKL